MSFVDQHTAQDASPGNFFVAENGQAVAVPTALGNYTGTLAAKDGAGAVVAVKTWSFRVLPNDTDVPEYGPNGKGCANNGVPVDGTPFDRDFTCDCTGVANIGGGNCDTEQSGAAASSNDHTATAIVAAVLAVFVLVALMALAVSRRRSYALKTRAFDFAAEIQRLKAEGEISDSLAMGGDTQELCVPREMPRACVSLIAKIGSGAFGEVTPTCAA